MTSPVDEDLVRAPSATTGAAGIQPSRIFGVVVVIAALLWLGFSSSWSWIIIIGVLTRAGVYAVSAMGLNLHFGYTGLLNFGQVGFMLVGAYSFALLVPHELGRAGTPGGNVPVLLAVFIAMGFGALLGLLLGIPTVRLRGDFLAIVTIAVAEILRLSTRSFFFLGSTFGVIRYSQTFDELRPGFVSGLADRFDVPAPRMWLFIVVWVVVLLVFVALWLMIKSPWGRVLRAIREDEDAARSLGKNAFWYKNQSLMIGGAIGALAGVLFALDLSQIGPEQYLPLVTFFVWTGLVVGGAGSLGGPIAGSIIFWVILTQSDNFLADPPGILGDILPELSSAVVGASRFVLMGVLLMLIMIFRPQGLFGKREELSLEIQ